MDKISDLQHQNKLRWKKCCLAKAKIEQSEKIKYQCKELVDVAIEGSSSWFRRDYTQIDCCSKKRLQHISEIHSKQLKMEREKYSYLKQTLIYPASLG